MAKTLPQTGTALSLGTAARCVFTLNCKNINDMEKWEWFPI
jgi:hypothetical protein